MEDVTLIKIKSEILNKVRTIYHKEFDEAYKKFKKNEKNKSEFYRKYLTPTSGLLYYLQWKILSQISIKQLFIKSGLDKHIKKNITKDYLIYSMIFCRNHVNSINVKNYSLKNILHYDSYGPNTTTFWMPLHKINKNSGGLIFLSKKKLSNKDTKNFILLKRYKNKNLYQVKCEKGEIISFNKSLFHGANLPKRGFKRMTLDLRIADKKEINLKKFNKNYYSTKGVFRPNKFLSLNKIDNELKKFALQNPRSLLQLNY
tara:strand:+ start:88 stop:861 length:774 start_codon:yes stop_codon:yes gene_type:complete